jgi:hypothetical protein
MQAVQIAVMAVTTAMSVMLAMCAGLAWSATALTVPCNLHKKTAVTRLISCGWLLPFLLGGVALSQMGAPVTSGITLTKFAGVVVLAFARTQIFEVRSWYYYCLMEQSGTSQ